MSVARFTQMSGENPCGPRGLVPGGLNLGVGVAPRIDSDNEIERLEVRIGAGVEGDDGLSPFSFGFVLKARDFDAQGCCSDWFERSIAQAADLAERRAVAIPAEGAAA